MTSRQHIRSRRSFLKSAGMLAAASTTPAVSTGMGVIFVSGTMAAHVRPASESHHQEEQAAEKQNWPNRLHVKILFFERTPFRVRA